LVGRTAAARTQADIAFGATPAKKKKGAPMWKEVGALFGKNSCRRTFCEKTKADVSLTKS